MIESWFYCQFRLAMSVWKHVLAMYFLLLFICSCASVRSFSVPVFLHADVVGAVAVVLWLFIWFSSVEIFDFHGHKFVATKKKKDRVKMCRTIRALYDGHVIYWNCFWFFLFLPFLPIVATVSESNASFLGSHWHSPNAVYGFTVLPLGRNWDKNHFLAFSRADKFKKFE